MAAPANRLFPILLGAFFGVALLKFGNPPIMERWVGPPANIYEFLLGTPWPIAWAYWMLAFLTVSGLWLGLSQPSPRPRPRVPSWLLFLPAIWLLWQAVATVQSLDGGLSWPTFRHFVACVACFYLGLFVLSRAESLGGFWTGLLVAFLLVLVQGWEQHFGGLEATRQFFFREIYPHLKEVPPEYLKKMSSNRIFSTLFYPNTLAGALLLFLPVLLAVVAEARELFTLSARRFLVLAISVGALGCLYWSGSKGGWLLLLLLALIALFQLRFSRSIKIGLVAGLLVFGLAGFIWKYAGFFEKGATSVSARFDYWEAALKTAMAHPLVGTGPGTFAIPYRELKRPESEMSRMVHNDYLEQASDSGWFGFIAYALCIGAGLIVSGRGTLAAFSRTRHPAPSWTRFCLWLGILGWALQSLSEFGLYIPALAWPAFTFLGFLLGTTAPAAAPASELPKGAPSQPQKVIDKSLPHH